MDESEIIYLLDDDDDVIPVKAEEVVCFQTELKPPWYRKRKWMTVELKDRIFLASDRYEGSEIDNLLRSLLKKNRFVFIKQHEIEIFPNRGGLLCGVRFSAIKRIGKYMDYLEYGDGGPWTPVLPGEVVESTVVNYKKWKESQEEKNDKRTIKTKI